MYQTRPVTHLSLRDDLKLFEENKTVLVGTLKMVANISEAVGMQFGVRKCSVAHVIGGKVIDGDEVTLNSGGTVKSERKQGSCKYLGVLSQSSIVWVLARQPLTLVEVVIRPYLCGYTYAEPYHNGFGRVDRDEQTPRCEVEPNQYKN